MLALYGLPRLLVLSQKPLAYLPRLLHLTDGERQKPPSAGQSVSHKAVRQTTSHCRPNYVAFDANESSKTRPFQTTYRCAWVSEGHKDPLSTVLCCTLCMPGEWDGTDSSSACRVRQSVGAESKGPWLHAGSALWALKHLTVWDGSSVTVPPLRSVEALT